MKTKRMNWTQTTAAVGIALAIATGVSIAACDAKPASSAVPTSPSGIALLGAHGHHGSASTGGVEAAPDPGDGTATERAPGADGPLPQFRHGRGVRL